MYLVLVASAVLLVLKHVTCNNSPGFCSENDSRKTIFANTGETVAFSICLKGFVNVAVNIRFLHGHEVVNTPNFKTYVYHGLHNNVYVNVVIDRISAQDFGSYLVIMSHGHETSDAPKSVIEIKQKVQPRLCPGQDDVIKLEAEEGTSPVIKFCVEANIKPGHYPYLWVLDRWIRSNANDYEKANFTYTPILSSSGRYEISVSFNNITRRDKEYVGLFLKTGLKEYFKLLVRIHVIETCREVFKLSTNDTEDFLLVCYSDCFPLFMGIRQKQSNFYINEWNTASPGKNYTLKASRRYFSCEDQSTYVCDITYSEEYKVSKEREVILSSCPKTNKPE